MRFVQGRTDDGRDLPLDDPLAPLIRSRLAAAPPGPASVVNTLLGLDTVFTPELAADQEVRAVLVDWLTALDNHGAAATLAGAR
jgi:fructuronate reductase